MYCPEEYFMWGLSDLVNPDLKKIIDEINIKNSKNFDSRLSFLSLLKMKFIRKTPDKIISNKALVCLVDLSEKGWGNSIPIR